MADIHWAIERLKEGKKVRRKIWSPEKGYLYLDFKLRCLVDFGVKLEDKKSNFLLLIDDFTATDWELADEQEDDDG